MNTNPGRGRGSTQSGRNSGRGRGPRTGSNRSERGKGLSTRELAEVYAALIRASREQLSSVIRVAEATLGGPYPLRGNTEQETPLVKSKPINVKATTTTAAPAKRLKPWETEILMDLPFSKSFCAKAPSERNSAEGKSENRLISAASGAKARGITRGLSHDEIRTELLSAGSDLESLKTLWHGEETYTAGSKRNRDGGANPGTVDSMEEEEIAPGKGKGPAWGDTSPGRPGNPDPPYDGGGSSKDVSTG